MKINTRYGEMDIPEGRDLISLSLERYGEWSQKEVDILLGFVNSGSVILDIGGYLGSHSRAFSEAVGENGKVLTYEPNEKAFSYLKRNAELSRCNNIIPFNFALGSSEKVMSIRYEEEQQNMGAASLQSSREGKEDVKVNVLDALEIDRVSLIKIDVEGMELDVLKGGSKKIREDRPIIFLEVNSVENSHAVIDWCDDNNYMIFGVITDAYNSDNFKSEMENFFGEAKECGFLLIPDGHSSLVKDALDNLGLPQIETRDDIVLLLLHKPQYPYEILQKTKAHRRVSINYPSPKLDVELKKSSEKESYLEEKITESKEKKALLVAEILKIKEEIGSSRALANEHDNAVKDITPVIDELKGFVPQFERELNRLQEELGAAQKEKFTLKRNFEEEAKKADAEKNVVIECLRDEIKLQKKLNEELLSSRSWRITEPLRFLVRISKGKINSSQHKK